MFIAIITHTPVWIWFLLAGLIYLGVTQLSARTASFRRVMIMPVVMTSLSVSSALSTFGAAPAIVLCWVGAAAVVANAVMRKPLRPGTHYLADTREFALPGSWVPLALIVSIFVTKYTVGVMLAMHAPLTLEPAFGIVCAGLYGIFSGAFIGRAARLRRLAFGRISASSGVRFAGQE